MRQLGECRICLVGVGWLRGGSFGGGVRKRSTEAAAALGDAKAAAAATAAGRCAAFAAGTAAAGRAGLARLAALARGAGGAGELARLFVLVDTDR